MQKNIFEMIDERDAKAHAPFTPRQRQVILTQRAMGQTVEEMLADRESARTPAERQEIKNAQFTQMYSHNATSTGRSASSGAAFRYLYSSPESVMDKSILDEYRKIADHVQSTYPKILAALAEDDGPTIEDSKARFEETKSYLFDGNPNTAEDGVEVPYVEVQIPRPHPEMPGEYAPPITVSSIEHLRGKTYDSIMDGDGVLAAKIRSVPMDEAEVRVEMYFDSLTFVDEVPPVVSQEILDLLRERAEGIIDENYTFVGEKTIFDESGAETGSVKDE